MRVATKKEESNRRLYPRVEAQVYCRPARLRRTPLPVSNIGFGGMRVYSDDANKVGQLLDIDVLVAGEAITCTVEVAWISRLAEPAPAKFDVGLRFVSVPPGFLHYLTELTATRGSGTVAIIVNRDHRPLAAEPLLRLMTEIEDLTALVVHDGADDCSCLAEIDTSMPWRDRISFLEADVRRHVFAINAALRRALGRSEAADYILLISPDVLVETGAIKTLHSLMVEQAHVGIASSSVKDDSGAAQPIVYRFPGLTSSTGPNQKRVTGPVPWVSSPCAMIRRDVVDSIGLFDDSMYNGFAAADFCLRAARAGWQTWLASESTVTAEPIEPFSLAHTPARNRSLFLASRDRFLAKNYGSLGRWLAIAGMVTRLAISSVWSRAKRSQLRDLWRYHSRPRWPAPSENQHNSPK